MGGSCCKEQGEDHCWGGEDTAVFRHQVLELNPPPIQEFHEYLTSGDVKINIATLLEKRDNMKEPE